MLLFLVSVFGLVLRGYSMTRLLVGCLFWHFAQSSITREDCGGMPSIPSVDLKRWSNSGALRSNGCAFSREKRRVMWGSLRQEHIISTCQTVLNQTSLVFLDIYFLDHQEDNTPSVRSEHYRSRNGKLRKGGAEYDMEEKRGHQPSSDESGPDCSVSQASLFSLGGDRLGNWDVGTSKNAKNIHRWKLKGKKRQMQYANHPSQFNPIIHTP
jgi:hypothetical protein